MVGDRLTPHGRDEPAGPSESASKTADVVPQPPPPGDYGVFWLDLNGRVTRWSDEARQVFGHSDEEAAALGLRDLFPESDRAAGVPERALEAARDRGAWDGVGWRVSRGGESFWATTSLTMVYTPNGLGIGVMAVVRRLEAVVSAGTVDADAQRLASLGRVASEVSHDVRNILSAIRGFAAVLERRLPDGDAAHQVWHELVKACDRGADLTERVLGVARSDSDTVAPVSVAETLRSLEPMLRQIVPPRIRLDIEAPDEIVPIMARRHDIELALLNVVVNARDAISGPGVIGVTLSEEPCSGSDDVRVVLCVRDTGKGMSSDIQDRIFDRFFTTKDSGRGTGLGMAMVRDSVQSAGGSIEIESAQGVGTIVRMLFDPQAGIEGHKAPTAASGRGGHVPSPGPRAATESDSRSSSRHKVLVWCISPVLRAAATDLLGRRGYHVVVATSRGAAEELMADSAEPIDCVIVDSRAELPVASKEVRPPVIALVHGTAGGAGRDGLAQDALDRVLEMPLDPRSLCDAVRQLAVAYEESRASVH